MPSAECLSGRRTVLLIVPASPEAVAAGPELPLAPGLVLEPGSAP